MKHAPGPPLGLSSTGGTGLNRSLLLGLLNLLVLGAGFFSLAVSADPSVAPPPRSKLPLADPVVQTDVQLKGQRAWAWQSRQDAVSSQWLVIENHVALHIGAYQLAASRAVLRIDTEPSPAAPIHHLMAYLENARTSQTSTLGAEAPALLVTASIIGDVELTVDALEKAPPKESPFLASARDRFERYLNQISQALPVPATPPAATAVAPQTVPSPATATATPPTQPAQVLDDRQIFSPAGTISFHADRIVYTRGDETDSISLMGNITVVYRDSTRTLSLAAQNAVILLSHGPGLPSASELTAARVLGVYLEDNVVATDGTYTVRAPRVYYDPPNNRALLLDAVVYRWDVRRQLPLYLRAQQIRQTSRGSFEASHALLTTSSFAEPHLAVAASRLTLNSPAPETSNDPTFTAENVRLQSGPVPFFYWPYTAGNATQIPLTGFSAQYGHTGPTVQTEWDVFSLLGQTPPRDVDLTANVDYLGDHGPATGLNLKYDLAQMFGFTELYLVPKDEGEDRFGDRDNVQHDGDTRGYALMRHRHLLAEHWEFSLEAAYVSDPTFLEEFRRDEAYTDKGFETVGYVKYQEQDQAFTFLLDTNLNDFTPQLTQLQTPGYMVSHLPEFGYWRVGTNLGEVPLTYYGENRLSRLRVDAGHDSPSDRGFNTRESRFLFDQAPNVSFEDAWTDRGVPDQWRLRLDSRHELQAPMRWGILDAVPYITGRVTAYDDDFQAYDNDADPLRLWGSAGTRLHTQFSRSDPDVQIPLLNVHGLRHVLEPYADVFAMGATADPEAYPVYDAQVEQITEGLGSAVGLRNTWQTRRGGPGRWRTVDWIVWDNAAVWRSDDAPTDQDVPTYLSYRPEYSTGGDHLRSRLMWMVTDALGVNGDATYGLEDSQMEQWRLGLRLQHTPLLTWNLNYMEIADLDSRLIRWGFTYQLTRKWMTHFTHSMNLDGQTRTIDLTLERRLPSWRLLLGVSLDEIEDDQVFSIIFVPEGITSLPTLFRPLPGADQPAPSSGLY